MDLYIRLTYKGEPEEKAFQLSEEKGGRGVPDSRNRGGEEMPSGLSFAQAVEI